MTITQVSPNEFSVSNGSHTMLLAFYPHSIYVNTINPTTARCGSLRRFETIQDVEAHYKSWRGLGDFLINRCLGATA